MLKHLIEFIYPISTKSVSLTGTACALNCSHCNGKYLQHMLAFYKIQNNAKLASGCWNKNITSLLISGGSDKNGKVPILAHLALLKKLFKHYELNAHVGLLSEKEIEKFKNIFSAVSFDFVADNKVIKEVYHLDKTVEDYIKSYKSIQKHLPVFPHLTLGLYKGHLSQESWEYEALRILIEELKSLVVVLNIFIPTFGTAYARYQPPKIKETEMFFKYARTKYPKTKFHLGCMRPKGKYRIKVDKLAVKYKFNRIVQPTKPSRMLAEELGYCIKEKYECCVL